MSFTDIIKNSVLDKLQVNSLSTLDIVFALGLSVLLGLFIYVVYRFNSRSGFYNRAFNKSLATLPVITAAIMLAMGSNLTISLGMVGALSIVRFRNAVKDPADLTYLFWSIGMGIIVGASLFELAIMLSATVAVLLSLLDFIPTLRAPCLLVLSGREVALEKEILAVLKPYSRKVKIRSRNVNKNGVEWIFELQLQKEQELLQKLGAMEGISSLHLMSHDGEVRF